MCVESAQLASLVIKQPTSADLIQQCCMMLNEKKYECNMSLYVDRRNYNRSVRKKVILNQNTFVATINVDILGKKEF